MGNTMSLGTGKSVEHFIKLLVLAPSKTVSPRALTTSDAVNSVRRVLSVNPWTREIESRAVLREILGRGRKNSLEEKSTSCEFPRSKLCSYSDMSSITLEYYSRVVTIALLQLWFTIVELIQLTRTAEARRKKKSMSRGICGVARCNSWYVYKNERLTRDGFSVACTNRTTG